MLLLNWLLNGILVSGKRFQEANGIVYPIFLQFETKWDGGSQFIAKVLHCNTGTSVFASLRFRRSLHPRFHCVFWSKSEFADFSQFHSNFVIFAENHKMTKICKTQKISIPIRNRFDFRSKSAHCLRQSCSGPCTHGHRCPKWRCSARSSCASVASNSPWDRRKHSRQVHVSTGLQANAAPPC